MNATFNTALSLYCAICVGTKTLKTAPVELSINEGQVFHWSQRSFLAQTLVGESDMTLGNFSSLYISAFVASSKQQSTD